MGFSRERDKSSATSLTLELKMNVKYSFQSIYLVVRALNMDVKTFSWMGGQSNDHAYKKIDSFYLLSFFINTEDFAQS